MANLLTLDNGLRVVTDPMAEVASAAIGVWFDAGAEDEAENENGLAHLLEHMAFKGTHRRTARQIAEEMENLGGHLNASTGYQRTGYYARILEDDVEVAFDIIADILTNPTFADIELAKEKDVVIQEIGEAADTPDDVVFENLQHAAFGDHTLGRPILGSPESVNAQTRDSLNGFMAKNYVPDSTIVTAAGAVSDTEIARLAEQYFGSVQKSHDCFSGSPAEYVGGSIHDARDAEQTHIALAFPSVASGDDRFYAMKIFSEALGGGMASRVFQEVREERGLAYSAYTFVEGYDEAGLLCAYLGTDKEKAGDAVGIVRQEIEKMAEKVTESELKRAVAMATSSYLMHLESAGARAEGAAAQTFVYGAPIPSQEIVKRIRAVTVDEVKACAAHVLDGAISLSVVGPCDFQTVQAQLTN